MGPESAFYADYMKGKVDLRKLMKETDSQETDPEFIKRCLDSCGSDCNLVKVEKSNEHAGECLKCPEINFEFLRLIKF